MQAPLQARIILKHEQNCQWTIQERRVEKAKTTTSMELWGWKDNLQPRPFALPRRPPCPHAARTSEAECHQKAAKYITSLSRKCILSTGLCLLQFISEASTAFFPFGVGKMSFFLLALHVILQRKRKTNPHNIQWLFPQCGCHTLSNLVQALLAHGILGALLAHGILGGVIFLLWLYKLSLV